MAKGTAFQQAYQKKREADAAELVRVAEANRRLEELWSEFVAMSGDLQRHGVTFEWGRTVATKDAIGDTIERVVILRQVKRVLDYANAVVFDSQGYRAWGAWGSTESDDYRPRLEDIGQSAAEAAAVVAERLVNKDALPASGGLPSFAISEVEIIRQQRRENLQLTQNLVVGVAIVVGLIWLFA